MNKSWITPIILGVFAVLILVLPAPVPSSQPVDRLVRIEASQFAYKPGILKVNPGDRIMIELTAVDVVHGLYLDNYNVSVTADPGRTARLEFVADKVGSHRFRCSVACGDMHPFMIGKLQVGTNWMYWRGMLLFFLVLMYVIWVTHSRKNGFNS